MLDFLLSFSCMLTVIQNEAKGENFYGKVAVGEVLRNRAEKEKTSICYQAQRKNQFAISPAISSSNYPGNETVLAAVNVLRGRTSILSRNTYFFCNPGNVDWPLHYLEKTTFQGIIGHHAFYSKDD